MKSIKWSTAIALCLFTMILVNSCNKKNGEGRLTVKMVDQPGDFDSVIVEVLDVEIHYADEDDEGGWVSLDTESGLYDLLLLQDGVSVVLSDSVEVPVGSLGQMRLILGTTNYVVVEGETKPLELSSQDKTGLKMNLNAEVADGDEIEVIFDFDANASIIQTGGGKYKLKPVIKIEEVLYL